MNPPFLTYYQKLAPSQIEKRIARAERLLGTLRTPRAIKLIEDDLTELKRVRDELKKRTDPFEWSA